jgi:hypothetical protein
LWMKQNDERRKGKKDKKKGGITIVDGTEQ